MKKNPLAYTPHLYDSKMTTKQNKKAWSISTRMESVTTLNSNARIIERSRPTVSLASPQKQIVAQREMANIGLNSYKMRHQMVMSLKAKGISDELILNAMLKTPRHVFLAEALASRAYDNDALPIGFGQTISQPLVVARMLSLAVQNKQPGKALEIGTGCGYQAAVMAHIFPEVYSIERIKGLYQLAQSNMNELKQKPSLHLYYGDGYLGLPKIAPFDTIVLAAAGDEVPQTLLEQLAIKGRLIAPISQGKEQFLMLFERLSKTQWKKQILEAVRFVPLLSGITE